MKAQQKVLLESIEQNYNNQTFLNKNIFNNGLYVSELNTKQQIFLQKLINIYVLRKKQYNKLDKDRIQKIISQYKGTFTDLLLNLRYMSYCMDNKVEVSYEKFGLLKLLTTWMDIFDKQKLSPKVNISNKIFSVIYPQNHTINTIEELIVYINYIASDLQTLFQRAEQKSGQQTNGNITKEEGQSKYSHLQAQDLLAILFTILPKTLFNIVIPQYLISSRPMTSANQAQQKQRDFLYCNQSSQYFCKQKAHYQSLLKMILNILFKMNLNHQEQKRLMTIGFKYFYIFNRDKAQQPFSIWAKIYQIVTQPVRFAMSDQFLLFFKIINKLGYGKFILFLRQKYQWINNILTKIDIRAVIGHAKDTVQPFNQLSIMEHINVAPGKIQRRYLQIYQPYSIFYFYIGIKNLDINVRICFMGSFDSPTEKKKLLINKQKAQFEFTGNIIAIQKGIYLFQFDNTYSWMKGKSIYYQNVILTPLQLTNKQVQKQKFLPLLYNKFDMNMCPQINTIDILNVGITLQKQNKQHNNTTSQNINKSNIFIENQSHKQLTNLSFNEGIYRLQAKSGPKVYEFQTDNSKIFIEKVKNLFNKKQKSSEWLIQGTHKLYNYQVFEEWALNPIKLSNSQDQKTESNKQSLTQDKQTLPKNKQVFIEQKKLQSQSQTVNRLSKMEQQTSNQIILNTQQSQNAQLTKNAQQTQLQDKIVLQQVKQAKKENKIEEKQNITSEKTEQTEQTEQIEQTEQTEQKNQHKKTQEPINQEKQMKQEVQVCSQQEVRQKNDKNQKKSNMQQEKSIKESPQQVEEVTKQAKQTAQQVLQQMVQNIKSQAQVSKN